MSFDLKRLVLHKLIQTNFKSYAGTVTIGPFHPSFTSVVGPNGSGKSNVIDSLLFVFGFKAKKLRQGKLSDLIHKSINYPDLDFCEVYYYAFIILYLLELYSKRLPRHPFKYLI
jgi:structural maintenance of chromosome 4